MEGLSWLISFATPPSPSSSSSLQSNIFGLLFQPIIYCTFSIFKHTISLVGYLSNNMFPFIWEITDKLLMDNNKRILNKLDNLVYKIFSLVGKVLDFYLRNTVYFFIVGSFLYFSIFIYYYNSDYQNIMLITLALVIFSSILVYINLIDENFRYEYPILYKYLNILCIICILVLIILLFVNLYTVFINPNVSGPSDGPSGGFNGGPSGGGGGPNGPDMPSAGDLARDKEKKERRARSRATYNARKRAERQEYEEAYHAQKRAESKENLEKRMQDHLRNKYETIIENLRNMPALDPETTRKANEAIKVWEDLKTICPEYAKDNENEAPEFYSSVLDKLKSYR
jgi:hypothetical protein